MRSTAAQLRLVPSSSEAAEDMLVGDSEPMVRVRESIARYAASSLPVLITGESGTGKELAARALHRQSAAAGGPLVAVNCGALPPEMAAAELFGHERGAFTGAHERRIGLIEQAAGGTLLLDEIGELPLPQQAVLLRFLQDGTIQRIGGRSGLRVRTRVIAATNTPLEDAVAGRRFREDLFYRLDVLRLRLPPLRERSGDIPALARFVLERTAAEFARPVPAIAPDALSRLAAYAWPGNVRELISRLQRAMLLADGPELTADDFRFEPASAPAPPASAAGLAERRAAADAEAVRAALAGSGFNVSRAARSLGVSRVTLYKLMARHGLAAGNGRADA